MSFWYHYLADDFDLILQHFVIGTNSIYYMCFIYSIIGTPSKKVRFMD